MFRNLAVCTVVLVAVLFNDALALHQGSYMPAQTDDTKDPMTTPPTPTSAPTPTSTTIPAVITPDHEKTMPLVLITPGASSPTTPGASSPTTPTTPLTLVPSVNTPTKEKGSHASDCNSNFPSVMPKETLKAKPAAMVAPPTSMLDVVAPSAPMPVVVTPRASTPTGSSEVTPIQPLSTPASEATNEQTGQKANTKSGTQSTNTSHGTIAVAGAIVAVAAVGVAVSQVKKARDADADAALVTPGENENIHIEIKNTPAGGSTIL